MAKSPNFKLFTRQSVLIVFLLSATSVILTVCLFVVLSFNSSSEERALEEPSSSQSSASQSTDLDSRSISPEELPLPFIESHIYIPAEPEVRPILPNSPSSQLPEGNLLTRQPEFETPIALSPPSESSIILDSEFSNLASELEEYKIWSLKHRKVAIQTQFAKDNVLFFIVLGTVAFGLYLSYIQFTKDEQSEGNLKLGPAGLEITSSILGVFILAFSVSFLYLYLVHVFPIQEGRQDSLSPVINSNSDTAAN
ncbi:hypothetical protein [Sphaerothrix gracilis]|uniref:hypothetical protein n=1 Tax=Sphaerothrix gracilis TaxID=3151835 RepID=UPI0031FD4C61